MQGLSVNPNLVFNAGGGRPVHGRIARAAVGVVGVVIEVVVALST